MARKLLLLCGIAASVLYVGMDIAGAMRWQGYSAASQAVSELRALGSPSRALLVPLSAVYSVLVIAFGCGVWASAGRQRALRVTGAMLVVIEVTGLAVTLFFPLHLRGVEPTYTDTMHAVLSGVSVVFIALAIGFGATVFGRRFRYYSIATLVTVLGFGAAAGLYVPRIDAQLSTPWLGVVERVCIGAYIVWVVVLATLLVRSRPRTRGLRQD